MKILVCGSEGRIMQAVINRLLINGHDIVGIDSGQKWGRHNEQRPYELIWESCLSYETVSSILREGIDGVIQAAASLYGVIGFHSFPADILSNDLAVQSNILSCCMEQKIKRVVYISSSMVYEKTSHCREDQALNFLPETDYGLSKVIGERIVLAYAKQYNLDFTIFRPFNALDPTEREDRTTGLSHVCPDLMHKIINLQQNPVEILGDGYQVRCFAHVNEIADVIANYSFDPRTKNKILNVGRYEPISIRELARKIYIKAITAGLITPNGLDNKRPFRSLLFKPLPVPQSDVRERIGDFSELEKCVGWKSKISLDRMLDECIDEYNKLRVIYDTSSN